MRRKARGRNSTAFTIVEVLVVLGVLTVLFGLLMPSLAKAKYKAKRIQCVSCLMQNGLGMRLFANDSTNAFPWQIPASAGGSRDYVGQGQIFRHFLPASNELGSPVILACPSDIRTPTRDFITLTNDNISYYVGLEAGDSNPQMILFGDRNITNLISMGRGIFMFGTNPPVEWTKQIHVSVGNFALADGSVQQVNNVLLQRQAGLSANLTNRIEMP